MKQQILKAIKETQSKVRNVAMSDNGSAYIECDAKQISIIPYLTPEGTLVLQVIMDSLSGNQHFLRELMLSPETMVNLALIFSKYISQAFDGKPSEDADDGQFQDEEPTGGGK